jgi:hypothetical protein
VQNKKGYIPKKTVIFVANFIIADHETVRIGYTAVRTVMQMAISVCGHNPICPQNDY